MIRTVMRAFVGEAELTERQGAILVAAAGVVFSFTAIAYRAVGAATDWQFLAYRGASTALAMVVLVLARRRSRPVDLRSMTPPTILAALTLAVVSMLYILALARTSAAVTAFMLAAAPVCAALLGWVLLRERVTGTTLVAIGLTAIGISIMVSGGLDAGSGTGVLLAALIPVLVGLYNVLVRSSGTTDPVALTLVSGVMLAVGTATVALIQTGLAISWRDIALATVTGGFALGVGLPMFNLGHRSVSAAKVSLLLMTEIVLAPLWVWIWPGETPRVATLVGGVVVMASVVWLMLRTNEAPVPGPASSIPSVDGM